MTISEYYDAVRGLGLTPTQFPEIFFTRDGLTQQVPSARDLTPEQRVEVFNRIRAAVEG